MPAELNRPPFLPLCRLFPAAAEATQLLALAWLQLPGSHRVPCWPADDTPENRAGANDHDRTQDDAWPFGVPSEEFQLRAAL